jgi:hypothetical protein
LQESSLIIDLDRFADFYLSKKENHFVVEKSEFDRFLALGSFSLSQTTNAQQMGSFIFSAQGRGTFVLVTLFAAGGPADLLSSSLGANNPQNIGTTITFKVKKNRSAGGSGGFSLFSPSDEANQMNQGSNLANHADDPSAKCTCVSLLGGCTCGYVAGRKNKGLSW